MLKDRSLEQLAWVVAEIGSGAQNVNCRHGPAFLLRRWHNSICSSYVRFVFEYKEFLSSDKLDAVKHFSPRLADTVRQVLVKSMFPVILGGDHSCAIGTWSGIADFYRNTGEIGLIWIDAHYDSHTPETSFSQAPHGMPLAVLLGYGDRNLTHIYGWASKISPAYTVLVGARSYEIEEYDLLNRLNVRVISMQEIYSRGISSCMKEAIGIASSAPSGFGVTFDLDVLDPLQAPGVGSPEKNGMYLFEAMSALQLLTPLDNLLGFELVEYNPDLDDHKHSTASVCDKLISCLFPNLLLPHGENVSEDLQ